MKKTWKVSTEDVQTAGRHDRRDPVFTVADAYLQLASAERRSFKGRKARKHQADPVVLAPVRRWGETAPVNPGERLAA